MKYLLAAVGFINSDIEYNKNTIIQNIQKYADCTDILVFGESFLQGFYGASFDYEKDREIAIEMDSPVMEEIAKAAYDNHVAVSFGLIEKSGDKLYSSQVTIGANGKIIDVYRRVSPGWKDAVADEHYVEGDGFHTFEYLGKSIAIGLCGDLWYEENIEEVKQLHPDVVLWPVYTDFNYQSWNETEKYEYAKQVAVVAPYVLYVNSVCLDKDELEIARGGAALFSLGNILSEIPAGQENVLIVEL